MLLGLWVFFISFGQAKEKLFAESLFQTSFSKRVYRYVHEISALSGIRLQKHQCSLLFSALRTHSIYFLNSSERKKLRMHYVRNRDSLIQQWEKNTQQTWPAGYHAHHIIFLRNNGPNAWWNIHPFSSEDHQKLHNPISVAEKLHGNR